MGIGGKGAEERDARWDRRKERGREESDFKMERCAEMEGNRDQ